MKFQTLAFLTALAATFSSNAFAQLPNSKVLTMAVAQAIAQEAMNSCKASGFNIAVLVVDSLNAPKVLLRADGAAASTAEYAKLKATTAMLFNRPSAPTRPVPPGQPAPPPDFPGTINSQGGVPIKVGDATIGAVGVSGARGATGDADCANAGIAKVVDMLK